MKIQLDRRKLLISAITGASGLALSSSFPSYIFAQQDTANRELAYLTLSDNLGLVTGAGSNILVSRNDNDELLIVDGGLEQHAEAVLALIGREAGSSSFNTLINTHWHREQTGLNQSLGQRGAHIFAHNNTRQWLGVSIKRPWDEQAFDAMPEQGLPSETFFHYGDLEHGSVNVQYGHLLQAHTDGDAYIYFPQENVLHAGGVVSNEGWPLLDWWTGGWINGLVNGMDRLLALSDDATVIVPSNGPLINRAELTAMRDMYATIRDRINRMFRAANSVEETLEEGPAREFEDRMGDSSQFVALAHNSLIPHMTPDA